MKRREALVSLAAAASLASLAACASASPADDLQAVVRQLGGFDLSPGEAPAVLASLKGSRYTAEVDPTIQPQSDFDPDVA
jgi:hypothetical protein